MNCIGLNTVNINIYNLIIKLIHPFDNYVILPGSLVLMNREPITLRKLL
jgi:hypothetical protein